MLPECHGPIWAIDDVSRCFQRKYLQLIFPLAACGLSLLYIVLRVVHRYVVKKKGIAYTVLVNDEAENGVSSTGPVDEEDGDDGEETDPMLFKATQLEQTRLELDRPRGQIAIITLEIAALVGLVITFVIVLNTNAWGDNGMLPAVGKLISWSYILFLVLVRFILSTLKLQSSPRLWNHTAALYGMQWLFNLFVFRSAVIYPSSKRALTLSAVEFALSTLLFLIAVTTRRGNKAVVVQREDGLEPPRHPTASLLSLVTFSWLDPLIWKGYRQPLELDDVWNLTTSQKAATVLEDFRRKHPKGSLVWRLGRYFYGTLLLQGAWTIFSNLFTYLPTLLLKAILEYVEDPRSTTA